MAETNADPRAKLRALREANEDGHGAPVAEATSRSPAPAKKPSPPAPAFTANAMVGRYAQRTFRLPPEHLARIRRLAEEEGISIAEAERWVVARGLVAYYEDGERPLFQRRARGRVRLPGESEEA